MPLPPSLGAVTSPFGMRYHPITGVYRMHFGEDTIGAGNYAPVTGTVIFAGYDTSGMGFGNAVGIRDEENPDHVWWVAHHERLAVSAGQRVQKRKTPTGPMGHTGAAKGDHAHTECRVGGTARPGSGTAINPRPLYSSGGGGGGGIPIEEEEEEGTMLLLQAPAVPPFDVNALPVFQFDRDTVRKFRDVADLQLAIGIPPGYNLVKAGDFVGYNDTVNGINGTGSSLPAGEVFLRLAAQFGLEEYPLSAYAELPYGGRLNRKPEAVSDGSGLTPADKAYLGAQFDAIPTAAENAKATNNDAAARLAK